MASPLQSSATEKWADGVYSDLMGTEFRRKSLGRLYSQFSINSTTALSLLTFQMAPFELLYHTKPGRGRVAPTEAILMIDPPRPCFKSWGRTTVVPK